MKFTVKRDKWRCGGNGENSHGKGKTELLNKEGYSCCLGFVANQLKIPKKALKEVEVPNQLEKENILCKQVEFDDYRNTDLSHNAIYINDDEAWTREEKEEKLANLFKDSGHELVFIGEYEDEIHG